MVCFQSTDVGSVGFCLWIRSCGGRNLESRNCSRRATVRLGIDAL